MGKNIISRLIKFCQVYELNLAELQMLCVDYKLRVLLFTELINYEPHMYV